MTVQTAIPTQLFNNWIGTTNTTIYEVPANKSLLLTNVTFTNNHTGHVTLQLFIVPSAGSVTNQYRRVNASLSSDDILTISDQKPHLLIAGDRLIAVSSVATAINCLATGILIENA